MNASSSCPGLFITGTDTEGFESVAVSAYAVEEVIAFNAVPADFALFIQPDNHRSSRMVLAGETTVIDAVMMPVETEPLIAGVDLVRVIGFDGAAGDPIVCAADQDDVPGLQAPVAEGDTVEDDVFSVEI